MKGALLVLLGTLLTATAAPTSAGQTGAPLIVAYIADAGELVLLPDSTARPGGILGQSPSSTTLPFRCTVLP